MLEKWSKYQADEVKNGYDQDGKRLIISFKKDYKSLFGIDICHHCNGFNAKFLKFIEKLKQMKDKKKPNCNYRLKKMYDGITLFGSTKYYKNDTLTDEDARHLIEKHPRGEGLFEVLPEEPKETEQPKAKKKRTKQQ